MRKTCFLLTIAALITTIVADLVPYDLEPLVDSKVLSLLTIWNDNTKQNNVVPQAHSLLVRPVHRHFFCLQASCWDMCPGPFALQSADTMKRTNPKS